MKNKIAVTSLMTCCAFVLIFLFTKERKYESRKNEIIFLQKELKLKDSLYLQCNGEINKINADPIYQFYIRNDLTFSE